VGNGNDSLTACRGKEKGVDAAAHAGCPNPFPHLLLPLRIACCPCGSSGTAPALPKRRVPPYCTAETLHRYCHYMQCNYNALRLPPRSDRRDQNCPPCAMQGTASSRLSWKEEKQAPHKLGNSTAQSHLCGRGFKHSQALPGTEQIPLNEVLLYSC